MDTSLKSLRMVAAIVLLCGLSAVLAQGADAANTNAPSAPAVLIELFTSEGCSSCPPADALLRELNGTRTSSGQLIVGISEHVTYWNGLGWSDPYSSETYTARQSAYANRFQLESVYTPQMVINGEEQIVGSDRNGLERALNHEKDRPQVSLHIQSASVANGILSVSFAVGNAPDGKALDIMAVLADDADLSSVLRGENSGRTLAHVAVARTLARVAVAHGATEKTVQLPLPSSFRPGQSAHHLILFGQSPNFGPVLATDSKPF